MCGKDIGMGFSEGLITLLIVALITVPFAVWKWIEIAIWIFKHVHFN